MVVCMAVWCIPGMTVRSICMHTGRTTSDNAYGLLRHAAFTPFQRVWHCTGVEEEDLRLSSTYTCFGKSLVCEPSGCDSALTTLQYH